VKVALASYAGATPYFDFLIPDRGLALLSAVLENAGVECRIYDLNRIDVSFSSFLRSLRAFEPDIVGFKFFDTGFAAITDLAQAVKSDHPRATIAAGGPHVSLFREHILHVTDAFDVLVYGEGERAILHLVESVSGSRPLASVCGAIYRDASGSIRTNPQDLIRDLDEIPRPAWQRLELQRYLPILMLNAYRGCPLTCAFCAHNRTWGYREVANGYEPVVRRASVAKVADEIRFATAELGVSSFGFTDSTPIPKLWLEIADVFSKLEKPVAWTSFGFVGQFDAGDLRALAGSGCAALWYGIESGSEALRARMGKRFTNADVVDTFALARAEGIVAIPGFILGFPGETEESFEATLSLSKALGAPVTVFSPFILDPGTPVALDPARYGVTVADDWQCKIVKRVGINEFEIPYYSVDGVGNVELWQALSARGVYPGFDRDRNIAESEYAYLLARSRGVDPHRLVTDLDQALKTRDHRRLDRILEKLWS
jgi:anaerobic magnesium-protoporphyrin IX monomethyl ester cyclase